MIDSVEHFQTKTIANIFKLLLSNTLHLSDLIVAKFVCLLFVTEILLYGDITIEKFQCGMILINKRSE